MVEMFSQYLYACQIYVTQFEESKLVGKHYRIESEAFVAKYIELLRVVELSCFTCVFVG